MKPPDDIPLPPHAYVPGRNARHDEAVFDAFHVSVREGMDTETLRQTLAWRAGWHFVRAGYFWEAHEVLEPVWMVLPPNSVERRFVQGVIQAANAALKLKMDRPKAALRLCGIANDCLEQDSAEDCVMGLPVAEVREFLEAVRRKAESVSGPNE